MNEGAVRGGREVEGGQSSGKAEVRRLKAGRQAGRQTVGDRVVEEER